MCKKCELDGISMALEPLMLDEIRKKTVLPQSWAALIEKNFHPSIIERAYACMGWSERTENPIWIKNTRAYLSSMGKGFLEPFDRKIFEPAENDADYRLKMKALDAVEELSREFGGRVSSVVWNSFAYLASCSEPEVQKSILSQKDRLPHHFAIVDNCLHAAGKVYTFMMRVQSVFHRHTGMILVHNCDCRCSLLNLEPVGGKVEFAFADEEKRNEATDSLFTHLCSEAQLILNLRLPFEYTITPEAQEIFGLQKTA